MKKTLLIGILFLGLAEFGYGAWIPAKAWLSQIMLAHSWQATLQDQQPHKPWPWADTWPVLKLSHKKSNQDLLVLNGASGQAMAFGPGLLTETNLPGTSGNTIISGHRDTHFAFLQTVQEGDLLSLQDHRGRQISYQIDSLDIVDSQNTELRLNTDEDLLTLVTCYPFNQIVAGGPLRYVVTASRSL